MKFSFNFKDKLWVTIADPNNFSNGPKCEMGIQTARPKAQVSTGAKGRLAKLAVLPIKVQSQGKLD